MSDGNHLISSDRDIRPHRFGSGSVDHSAILNYKDEHSRLLIKLPSTSFSMYNIPEISIRCEQFSISHIKQAIGLTWPVVHLVGAGHMDVILPDTEF